MKRLIPIFLLGLALTGCNRNKAIVVHASFTTDKDVYDLNEPVFINNTSTVENGLIGICKWEWGDDNTSFLDDIDCIYFNDIGDYQIKLTVYADGGGGKDTFIKSVKIEDHSEPETGIIYVSTEGAGAKDGSSWDNALDCEALRAALSGDLSQFKDNTFRLQSGLYEMGDEAFTLDGKDAEEVRLSISGGFSTTGGVSSDPSVFTGKGSHGIFEFKGKLNAYFNRCTFAEAKGSAIKLDNSEVTVQLNRCTVTGSVADNGGAVNISAGSLVATSTTFSENTATADGGAFYLDGGSVSLSGCTISDNTATHGAGLYFAGPTDLKFDGENVTTFQSNGSTGGGGGFYFNSPSDYELTGCLFKENRTDGNGGALFNAATGMLSVVSCDFQDNFASLYGGGIYDENSCVNGMEVTGCTFKGNDGGTRNSGATAKSSGGGAIALGGGLMTVQSCAFEDNFGQFGGAVIAAKNSTADFIQCNFTSNKTNLINAWNCYGGVLYIHPNNASSSLVRFNKCFMGGNSATSAGVLYAQNGTIYMNACAMYNNFMSYQCGSILQNSGAKVCLNNCTISKGYSKYKMSTYTNAAWIYLKNAGRTLFSNCSIIGLTYHNSSTYTGSAGLIFAETANSELHIINSLVLGTTTPSTSVMQAITAKVALTSRQTYLYNKMSSIEYAEDRISLSTAPETLNGTDYLATTDYFGVLSEDAGTSFNTCYWSWNGSIIGGTNPGKAATEDVNAAIKSVDNGFWNWLDEINALGKDQRGMARGTTSWPGAYDGGTN